MTLKFNYSFSYAGQIPFNITHSWHM